MRTSAKLRLQGKAHLIAVLFGIFAYHCIAVGYDCQEWFEKLKFKPGSATCVNDCVTAADAVPVDSCSPYCRGMCVAEKNNATCKLEPFWVSKLNGETKPFGRLHGDDLKAVETALARMPKSFRPKKLKAIVRSSFEIDITSSSPVSSSDEYIILFSKVFLRPSDLPRIITHEISHFLIENEWRSTFQKYRQFSGWNSLNSGKTYREGDFVDFDGKFSPEEDFANNIEFYLFDPAVLKAKSPKLFDWIKVKLGVALKLEKGCAGAK